MNDRFDAAYFAAGPLRTSRSLTQSFYGRHVLEWGDSTGRASERPRALEIGCGLGYASELLAERGYEVVATDVSPYAIEEARKEIRDPRVELSVWDATTPAPFTGGFDMIVAFEVVEHLPDPRAAIAAWRELLAPGGLLLLTTPNRLGPAGRWWRDPTHLHVQSPGGWRRTLRAAGPWQRVKISAVQFVPFAWRLDGVMRALPLPLVGATLRVAAVRDGDGATSIAP